MAWNWEAFSAWLREQMDKKRYSQARLAQMLGVSQSLISNWLLGIGKPPDVDKLVQLSGLFRFPHLALMELTGILSERDPALPNGMEQQVVDRLIAFRDDADYKDIVQAVITFLDLLGAGRDRVNNLTQEESREEV